MVTKKIKNEKDEKSSSSRYSTRSGVKGNDIVTSPHNGRTGSQKKESKQNGRSASRISSKGNNSSSKNSSEYGSNTGRNDDYDSDVKDLSSSGDQGNRSYRQEARGNQGQYSPEQVSDRFEQREGNYGQNNHSQYNNQTDQGSRPLGRSQWPEDRWPQYGSGQQFNRVGYDGPYQDQQFKPDWDTRRDNQYDQRSGDRNGQRFSPQNENIRYGGYGYQGYNDYGMEDRSGAYPYQGNRPDERSNYNENYNQRDYGNRRSGQGNYSQQRNGNQRSDASENGWYDENYRNRGFEERERYEWSPERNRDDAYKANDRNYEFDSYHENIGSRSNGNERDHRSSLEANRRSSDDHDRRSSSDDHDYSSRSRRKSRDEEYDSNSFHRDRRGN